MLRLSLIFIIIASATLLFLEGCGSDGIDGMENEYYLRTNVRFGTGGKVILEPYGPLSREGHVYAAGTRVTLMAEADPCYEFEEWNGAFVSYSNPIEIVMNQDKLVNVMFRKASYEGLVIPGIEEECKSAADNMHGESSYIDLVGDKDGFGIGLACGKVHCGKFDHRETEDPEFTDVCPIPDIQDFGYSHSYDPVTNLVSANLTFLTYGIQDGDNQVYQSDIEIQLFLNSKEVPLAFDDVDQFDKIDGKWVSWASYVTINIPENLLKELESGELNVRIKTSQQGESGSLDSFAIDFSELTMNW